MSFEISISDDGSYIRVKVFENINGALEKDFAEKAIKEAKIRSINRFLVDVRGTKNIATTVDQYLFGHEDLRSFALDSFSSIVILVDEGDESHNFIETVLKNAGFMTYLTTDEGEALKWLIGRKQGESSKMRLNSDGDL